MFVARQSYQRRRVSDAVRMVLILGIVLFMLPLLSVNTMALGGRNPVSGWWVFIFVAWIALIAVSAVLSRKLIGGLNEESGVASEKSAEERS